MSAAERVDPKASLVRAVVDAFADMTFLDVAQSSPADTPAPTSHVISVGFTHPVRGQIALYLPFACKQNVVQNVYGQNWDELTAADIDDCLLELGNVLAGSFLNVFCGTDAPRSVSLPALLFDDAELSCDGKLVEVSFEAEGLPFRVLLCLSGAES